MQNRWIIFMIWGLSCISLQLSAQSIRQIENNLNNTFGAEKLAALNTLTDHYYQQNSKKAIKYGKQAVTIGENLYYRNFEYSEEPEVIELVTAYNQLGKALYKKGDYVDAQSNFRKAERISNMRGYKAEWDVSILYLTKLDSLSKLGEVKDNFFSRTLGNLEVGEMISETSEDIKINNEIRIAEKRTEDMRYQDAIEHYKKAINLLQNQGNSRRINALNLKIAELYEKLEDYAMAREFLGEAIAEQEDQMDSVAEEETLADLDTGSFLQVETLSEEARTALQSEKEALRKLMAESESSKDPDKSIEYLKRYQELTQKIREDSIQLLVEQERRDREMVLLQQEKKIADLNFAAAEEEKAQQVRLRNNIFIISLVILVGLLVIFYLYFLKRKENRKLSIAYSDLDQANSKLADAEKRIVKLLNQQVSGDIAEELLKNENSDRRQAIARKFVCIMFVDIRDFTPLAETMSPEELIDYQNKVFGFMIDIVNEYNGNINQLLGDGFMATFGAPVSRGNDCQNAYDAATAILETLEEKNKSGSIQPTKIGIGLHAGYVVTGNVGTEERKQYSITGNTVIIAARIEQLNKNFKSQLLITEEVFNKLDHAQYTEDSLFEVKVKGRSNPIRIMKIA